MLNIYKDVRGPMRSLLLSICLILCSVCYGASTYSPVGQWFTASDIRSKDAGIIEVSEKNGQLFGKILKNGPNSELKYCQHCPGNLKNKPVLGMTFMWGFVPKGYNTWVNGKVIDPRDGKIYNATMELSQDGAKLHFRGYWYIFWSTRTWVRVNG